MKMVGTTTKSRGAGGAKPMKKDPTKALPPPKPEEKSRKDDTVESVNVSEGGEVLMYSEPQTASTSESSAKDTALDAVEISSDTSVLGGEESILITYDQLKQSVTADISELKNVRKRTDDIQKNYTEERSLLTESIVAYKKAFQLAQHQEQVMAIPSGPDNKYRVSVEALEHSVEARFQDIQKSENKCEECMQVAEEKEELLTETLRVYHLATKCGEQIESLMPSVSK